MLCWTWPLEAGHLQRGSIMIITRSSLACFCCCWRCLQAAAHRVGAQQQPLAAAAGCRLAQQATSRPARCQHGSCNGPASWRWW